MKNEDKLLIFGVYEKLIDGIKHFDNIQTTYRTLASTILLASFVGIGFIFSSQAASIPLNQHLAAIVVAFIGLVMVTAIYCVDLLFQEKLLIANFIEAVKLEREHDWLPQAHSRVMAKGQHAGSPNRKVLFYIGCGTCLLLIMCISILSLFDYSISVTSASAAILMVLGIFLYGFLLWRFAGKFEVLVRKNLAPK